MAGSWFTLKKDAEIAAGSANFATRIATAYASLNITQAQATAFGTLNTAFQAALAAITPATKSKSLVAAKNSARDAMLVQASFLGRQIALQPSVSDQTKIDLGLAVRGVPVPRPAPGTPYKFESTISINGVVTTKWKCENPKGSAGTMYQVYRRLGEAGAYAYLGGVGEKKFVDAAIPAGTASVTYQVQAVRSTAAGEWAEYKVQLGGGAGENGVPVTTTAAVKIAA